MEDELITLLESFKYEVYKQGSMNGNDGFPETFITFWNTDSPDHSHYDNSYYGTAWNFNIFVYSSNHSLTYSLLDEIRALLIENRWIVPSKGQDVDSDIETHDGRMITAYYLETE